MEGLCRPMGRVALVVLLSFLFVPAAGIGGSASAWSAAAKSASTTRKVQFVELGSVGCKPCEAMKPVMEEVRRRYGSQVEVIFHDVRRDPAMGRAFNVVLIPTQVFLDANGREAFRHQGFLPFEEVQSVLKGMGVR